MALIVATLYGCAFSSAPLTEESREALAKNADQSILVVRYTTDRGGASEPSNFLFSPEFGTYLLRPYFAVANIDTGWGFRMLKLGGQFPTFGGSFEFKINDEGGWLVLSAPAGKTYIGVYTAGEITGYITDFIAEPVGSQIVVRRTGVTKDRTAGLFPAVMLDFVDAPRFLVQIPVERGVYYGGTIVRTLQCESGRPMSSDCPYKLEIVNESDLAARFIKHYQKSFPFAQPIATQLLSISHTRTIEIRTRQAD